MDEGKLPEFTNMRAPKDAIKYYDFSQNASFKDVVLAVRADEACHREVNHHCANID